MHMADALLSPTVGAAFWAATAGVAALASRRLQAEADDRRVPLMGVLGAFLFAAQMINFSIPGTGSSGHLGGGFLLALLLGPHAAFLVMASVLTVQALFFADGGLLALGCNIFNLGFLPAYVVLPLVRRWIGVETGGARLAAGAMVGAVLSLQLGAFAVVLQTVASGISALPFGSFVLFMLPIHLAIGIVEGLVTASVLGFVHRARPDVLPGVQGGSAAPVRGLLAAFGAAALALGGFGAWYASGDPDGLEWSIAHTSGQTEAQAPTSAIHHQLGRLQQAWALMPDYAFAAKPASREAPPDEEPAPAAATSGGERLGTSVAGIVGALLTLALALLAGGVLRLISRRQQATARH
jgi:cobalt/nickel transport system permease protein